MSRGYRCSPLRRTDTDSKVPETAVKRPRRVFDVAEPEDVSVPEDVSALGTLWVDRGTPECMRCVAGIATWDLANNDKRSLCQSRVAIKSDIVYLSGIIASGAREGTRIASTERI